MRMKRGLTLLLALAMILSLLMVPASAEAASINLPGVGNLAGEKAYFTITAGQPTIDNDGNVLIPFTVSVSSETTPIRAFSFALLPSEGLTLAEDNGQTGFTYRLLHLDKLLYKESNGYEGYYSQFSYTPATRYFAAAGSDEGKGIREQTDVMTIMGKIPAGSADGTYTLSMVTGEPAQAVVAGNGKTLDHVSDQYERVITPAAFAYHSANTVSGKVTDDEGKPLADATVTLQDADGKALGGPVTTGGEGTFSFADVPNGAAYSIVVTAQDGALNGGKSVTVAGQDVNAESIIAQKYQLGDVNKDGSINSDDVTRLLRHVAKIEALPDEDVALGDVTGDKKTDADDVTKLLRFVSHIITSLD